VTLLRVRLSAWSSAAVMMVVAALLGSLAERAEAASPPSAGRITVTPATGSDLTAFTLITSDGCPSGTNVFASIFGAGFPASGKVIVGNAPVSIYEHTSLGGLALPSANTLRAFVNEELDPQPLSGRYRLQVSCRDGAEAADLGDFEGLITFTGPHVYTATNPKLSSAELDLLPAVGIAHPLVAPSQGQAQSKAKAPTAKATAPVTKAEASPASKASSRRGDLNPWVFGAGGGLVFAGLIVLLRGRRGAAVAA
jgi:hypothetical protein